MTRPTTATPVSTPRRWAVAVGFALVPVLFTAAGAAIAQIMELSDVSASLVLAATTALSAAIGVLVLSLRGGMRAGGFRAPRRLRDALWLLPALAVVLIVIATQPPTASPSLWLASAVLLAAVAVNEEVWFRGNVLSVLRPLGAGVAIGGSTLLFAVLHLANLASGESIPATVLQVAFAAVFGLVAAQLVVLTGSLWPGIVWHAVWNFANVIGGNLTTPWALTGIGVAIVVLIMYSLLLARRIAAPTASEARG